MDYYRHFVEKLIYLPSVAEIQNAVRSASGLQLDELVAALDDFDKSLLQAGRGEERELLAYVRELLDPVIGQSTVDTSATIVDAQMLLKSALRQPTALRMRDLLKRHRSLLSEQVLKELQFEAIDTSRGPSSEEKRIKLFCVAALVTNDPPLKVNAYICWAAFHRRRGRLKKSERPLLRGARLTERLGDPALKRLALGGRIGLYRAWGDLDKALDVMEQMLQMAVEDGDLSAAASMRMGIAQCCYDLGQYPRALDNLNSLISDLDCSELRRTANMLRALELRGLALEMMGRYDQGLLDYERGREVAWEMGDRNGQFIAMSNAAASFQKRGLKQEGYRRFSEILQTVTAWGNQVMIASTHNNLGSAFLDLGQPADAIVEYQKALKYKINSSDKKGEAIAAIGMGDAEFSLGRREEAEALYTLALVSGIETGDVSIISLWAQRIAGGKFGIDNGNIETLEWALGMAKAYRDKFLDLSLTRTLCNLHVNRNEKEKALDLYRGAIQQGRNHSQSAPEFLPLLIEYARLLAEEPRSRREAYELLTAALEEIKANLREVVYDERRAEIIARAIELYAALLFLLLDQEETNFLPADISPLVFAFDLHESAKSRSFISELSDFPLDMPAGVPRELIERESDLLELERGYQKVESEDVSSEVYREERLRGLRKDLQECWRKMELFAPHYVRFRSGDPYTYQEIRQILEECGENIAFISFFCDESSTTAFVIRRGQKEPSVYRSSLGREEVEDVVRRLQRAFNGAPGEFPPYPAIVRDQPFRRKLDFLERLSAQLLRFLPDVEDVELLCIAPHGPLHLVPFHALLTPDGDYLAKRQAVVYSPSLSAAAQLRTIGSRARATAPAVLVAGVSAAEDAHPEFFERDAEIFDHLRFEITSKVGVLDAARPRVLDALPGYDIIHLSCHGYFEEKNALNSGLLLSDGKRKSPRNPWSIPIIDRHRFLITVRDLLRARLRANLVTLNACSTGLHGQRNAGDELEGFSRALLLSGVSSVMLTLWNVDQESSRHFLASFYRNWIGSDHPVEKWRALQRAQREFLASSDDYLRHPYHWAPFTLAGDWR
jgi:CHAT domain-containing protein